jgi:hypothetical protein
MVAQLTMKMAIMMYFSFLKGRISIRIPQNIRNTPFPILPMLPRMLR